MGVVRGVVTRTAEISGVLARRLAPCSLRSVHGSVSRAHRTDLLLELLMAMVRGSGPAVESKPMATYI